MMIKHYALHYKNRILQTFLIVALGLFCYSFTNNISTITDNTTPLSSGSVEAMFYVKNEETGSLTCIGDGLIKDNDNINNDTSNIVSSIISSPNYSSYIGSDSYIVWNSISLSNGKYQVFGTIHTDPANKSVLFFPTVQELKKANLSAGDIVKTNGYYNENDGGASTYIITADNIPIDNMFILPLNNGLKAKLQVDNTVNVLQVGIKENTYISDKLNQLLSLAEQYKIDVVVFNNNTYYIDKPIALKSLSYMGTDDTKFIINESFSTNDDKVFFTYPDISHNSYTLDFSNITFEFIASKNSSQLNKELIIMSLQEIEQCNISNCKFYALPDPNNPAFMKIDLLWFKHSSRIENIKITECCFKNLTGNAYIGDIKDHLVGGCLWFCGTSKTTNLSMKNIIINNCEFQSTVSDEILAIWRGHYDNLQIYNCSFTNTTHDSDNLFSLYNGKFTNTNIDNCHFNVYSACKYICKITALTGDSTVNFNSNTFNLDSGITDSKDRNISIFFTGSDSKEVAFKSRGNIRLSNCIIQSSKDTVYRALVNISNTSEKTYNLETCSINAILDYGLFTLEGTNNAIAVESSTINTNNFISTIENTNDCYIILNENTILNKLNNVVRGNTNIHYTFTNNVCTSPVYGTQFVGSNLSTDDSIYLSNHYNSFTSGAKLYEFFGDTVSATDVIIKE